MTTFYTRYPSSSGGGGIISINGSTVGTQVIAAGSGISVVSALGTTTISSTGITSLTGDVTGTGPGATATTIAAGAVTNAKIVAAAGISVNKLAALTASRAVVSDGSGFITPATTTATEIGYVNGVTSAIQTQLNAKICANQEVSVSSNVTLTNKAVHFVDTSSARTLTFPAPSVGAYIALKDITGSQGPNFTTLVPSGSEKIEGVAANYYLTEPYGEAEFVSDGTDWWFYGPKQKEYAYNSSTDDANNNSSFGYGPLGAQFIQASAQRSKTVRFKNTITVSNNIRLEYSTDTGATWLPAGQWGGITIYLNLAGVGHGIGIEAVNTIDYNAGIERWRLPGNSYGGTGVNWAAVALQDQYRWRLCKL